MRSLRYYTSFFLLVITAQAFALEVSVFVNGSSYCGQAMGVVRAFASGGVPPYTYAWSNGGTQSDLTALPAGIYSVTVTDSQGTTATAQGEVVNYNAYTTHTFFPSSYCNDMMPWLLFFGGTQYGLPPDPATGSQHGPGPYTFNAPGYSTSFGEWPDGCGGQYSYYGVGFDAPPGANVTVNYTDGAGCPGSISYIVPAPIEFPSIQVVDVSGSCSNGAIGSATLSIGAVADQQTFRIRLKNGAHQVISNPCDMQAYGAMAVIQNYNALAPGTYWIVADVDVTGIRNDIPTPCADSISFTVPDLGITCGLVSGRLYIDDNANCTYNGGESMVPITIIEITPGPYYTTTDGLGSFAVDLPFGTYQFSEQHPVVEQNCALDVVVSSGALPNQNIGCAGGMQLDARVLMANGAARPGFDLLYAIDVDNLTTAATGAVTLTVQADPNLVFVAMNAPATVVGNVYTWNLIMNNAFEHHEIGLRMHVPPDVNLIGTVLNTSATLSTANTDVDLGNNSASSQQLVTGSFDPNDKKAITSSRISDVSYFLDEDEWIDYTIRFQNTGTDTAFNVVITDTLLSTLDPATIQWGPSSHTCTRAIEAAGTLKFVYANILLPDSTTNEPQSHGFVSFRIRPYQPVLPGTFIENTANIFFDFNPPVITEPSVLVAEFSTSVHEQARGQGQLRLLPNPVSDQLMITSDGTIQAITIVASDGREVMHRSMRSANSTIDVADLSAGSYFLLATMNNGSTTRERFIKQ
jgi:Secretion system C-terminal sorting domain